MSREPDLFALAERIADGAAIDWAEAEASLGGPHERRVLSRLRVVEEVVRFHRTLDGAPTIAPPERWRHLELREPLGAGAAGRVFAAWEPTLEREVALKLVPAREGAESSDSDLLREARLLARLRHPNVVTVHGAERDEGWVGIWMERVRGASLADLVRARGPFGADEAALVGRDLCRALAAVHQAGLVHRDVKAQNVLREEGGRIVLTDFGVGLDLALPAAPAGEPSTAVDSSDSLQPTPTLAGTPLYLAPEVLAGGAPSPASDLYALGVLLFFLVTGEFPVRARGMRDLRAAHAAGTRARLRDLRPDLPESFVRAVERAIAPVPEARFASAGAFEEALADAPPVGREARSVRRSWPVTALVGGLAALAIGVALVSLGTSRDGAASGAYEVRAQLFRAGEGGTRSALSTGDAVRVGDYLGLELGASRPLHLYVLSEDARGAAFLLYPLRSGESVNPLPPGEHVLPGGLQGEPIFWQVSSDGGEERILVVASPDAQRDLEVEISRLPAPRVPGEEPVFAELTEPTVRRLRGIGWLGAPAEVGDRSDRDRANAAHPGAIERVRALASARETARGTWVREVVLTNLGR